MTELPVAQVVSVDREPGIVRLDVLCPYCGAVHHHQWLNAAVRFTANAPCSTGADLRRYHVKMQSLSPSNRDDNAFDDPVPNWDE
ncbi:hypothetical protein MPRI_38060 [Mycobacterium paraintracellulare]|uniref:Uncharacterized protein n=1 Tax=Mycobacterium paraintracellulare TaxID=1138383 RepID=A0ABN6AUX1_9MYCO|nr:hypothetical protein MPRI_38060 [Mycobacterium paraintracellulare]